MSISEKLSHQMRLKGLNQQGLARLAMISDSEVSRILNGKSSPSLEYALRLARALGVSVDYLADERIEANPGDPAAATDQERELLESARELGVRPARRLLEITLGLGYDLAIRRLLGLEIKPLLQGEPDALGVGGAGRGRASTA